MPRIVFTVTSDLTYVQRMIRICTSLANNGYTVHLIGRKRKSSISLIEQPYLQTRLNCFFEKGPFFYLEYNIRLFVYLLFTKADVLCAIDLDTALPCLFVSMLRKKKRVYDAHEWFTQQKEIITRPLIHKIWLAIEQFIIPRFKNGYSVNDFITNTFKLNYKVSYEVIRNLPNLSDIPAEYKKDLPTNPFILCQGAVNEGRSLETLIPAMQYIPFPLVIAGNGNFYTQLLALVAKYKVKEKIFLTGMVTPMQLKAITQKAHIGLMLFEAKGLNQYQSLANRFFDYMMAGIPQICVDYPQYKQLNNQYGFAYMIDSTEPETIAAAVNNLMNDSVLYNNLRANALKAREELNWEKEERKLIRFYKTVTA